MREIKFRAWYSKCKLMVMPNLLDGAGNVYEFKIGKEPEHIQDAILMQYTGLKDKKGKEIWEGDILQINRGLDSFICQVIYEHGAFLVSGLKYDNYLGSDEPEHRKIIGNIYESPELLE